MYPKRLGIAFLICAAAFSQVPGTRFYNGWGVWSDPVHPDSLTNPHRIEYYRNGQLSRIQFFDTGGKFVKQHEYIYNTERLSRIIVYDNQHHVKTWYQLDYDPLMMSWKLEKRSAKGEYMGSLYVNDLVPDSTVEDSEFLIGLPGIVYPEK